jgi:hypothetical protein
METKTIILNTISKTYIINSNDYNMFFNKIKYIFQRRCERKKRIYRSEQLHQKQPTSTFEKQIKINNNS